MISQALTYISAKINSVCFPPGSPVRVILGNVATLYDPGRNEPNVILSLVNIEEEVLLRNPEDFFKRANSVVYKNPPIFLNLTILFGAYRFSDEANMEVDYRSSLLAIQNVIGFFQRQNVFDHSDLPELDAHIEKLSVEMVNMNMEQLHHLWSMLGGKYLPSVAYKMRLVMIDTAPEISEAPLISQIVIDDKIKFQQ
jgi:hypothetical protein